jgi:hypothetical protein
LRNGRASACAAPEGQGWNVDRFKPIGALVRLLETAVR